LLGGVSEIPQKTSIDTFKAVASFTAISRLGFTLPCSHLDTALNRHTFTTKRSAIRKHQSFFRS
jgi:hypothetical protein